MERNIQGTFIAWSALEIETLQRHWKAGLTTAEIASRLGKTTRAVECKVYKLRVQGWVLPARRRGGTERCLFCGDNFASRHKGNRICPGCLEDGPFTSAMV